MTGDQAPAALINPDAEASLLGGAMQENQAIDIAAEIVAPEDFGIPLHGRIWSMIVLERHAGRHVNPATLRGHFEDDPDILAAGGVSYLMRLTANLAALLAPASELAKQIKELSTRRRIREGLRAAADRCADLSAAVSEIVSDADAAIRGPSEAETRHTSAGTCMDALVASLDEPRAGITCGLIESLDDLLATSAPVR